MYQLSEEQKKAMAKRIPQWLYNYCKAAGLHSLVFGVSGGLDSAVVAALAKIASDLADSKGYTLIPVGLILPCHTDLKATKLGRLVIEKFEIEKIELDLTRAFDEATVGETKHLLDQVLSIAGITGILKTNRWHEDERFGGGNRKARMRMIQLYTTAKMLGGAVISTSNWSEEMMGFWTLHGDIGDIGPIMELLKGSELPQLAEYLGVPQAIINAIPDDGLGIAKGGDAAQLGAPYDVVDLIMVSLIQQGFKINGPMSQLKNLPSVSYASPDLVIRIAKRCLMNVYKRKANTVPCFKREKMGLLPIKKLKLF